MDTLLLSGLLVVVTTILVAKFTSVVHREHDRITRMFEDLHRRIDGVEQDIERREETMFRHVDQVHQDLLKENGSLVRSLKK